MSIDLAQLCGIPRDTSLEAYRVQCQALRRLSAEQRGRLMVDIIEFVNAVSAAGVRSRHPDYSDEQVRMAVIQMRLGEGLFKKVYPGVEVAP
jgi:hypothetical protein